MEEAAFAGIRNLLLASQDMEYERCPFCGSFGVEVNMVDGRKATPSECLDCGASEVHPYYDTEETLSGCEVKDGWKKLR
jgi:hypothetical protein